MDAGNYRADANGVFKYPDENLARPGYSTTGRDVQLRINQFKVNKWPQRDIYQYDVSFLAKLFYDLTDINLGPSWFGCREDGQDQGRLGVKNREECTAGCHWGSRSLALGKYSYSLISPKLR